MEGPNWRSSTVIIPGKTFLGLHAGRQICGYEFDSETSDYYAVARYYDPRLGRFPSAYPASTDSNWR